VIPTDPADQPATADGEPTALPAPATPADPPAPHDAEHCEVCQAWLAHVRDDPATG
jgi:hypothetical protein